MTYSVTLNSGTHTLTTLLWHMV